MRYRLIKLTGDEEQIVAMGLTLGEAERLQAERYSDNRDEADYQIDTEVDRSHASNCASRHPAGECTCGIAELNEQDGY